MVGGPSDIEIVAALRAATPAARRELITAMDDLLTDTDSLHARLVVPDRRPDGSLGFPYPKHSPALARVCTALYAADVIVVFDWREWEGGNAYPGGAGLETATIADVARLLTFAVRSERFYDNALVESFMSTLKTELIERRSWPTRQQARTAIYDYIEGWYNPRRRHSALGYLSPAQFEAQHHRWQESAA